METGTVFSFRKGLAALKAMGFEKILGEGGGRLNRSLLSEGLVSRLYLTIAPVIIGGEDTPNLCAGERLPELARFTIKEMTRVGDELHLVYECP